jgi:hypothetical protein
MSIISELRWLQDDELFALTLQNGKLDSRSSLLFQSRHAGFIQRAYAFSVRLNVRRRVLITDSTNNKSVRNRITISGRTTSTYKLIRSS